MILTGISIGIISRVWGCAQVLERTPKGKRVDGMTTNRLYSIADAAAYLGGVSKWTLHAWLAKGKLPRTKVGGRTMVRESDLEAFVEGCNLTPKTAPAKHSRALTAAQ